ncbi:hypothetical protein P6U16_10240 [Rhizobium sp. 32-5/1]|uniref:hypothetical protein n=1 Tax=Rhizobium sp. 32-5/1 TaxID=3019602 RepID=UPI00240D6202|nr:hypothetical protein [Rhizobium sp. 32-5/1]WEZ84870.1 hypothetical protein P6U16_10240 [Rhizobium sp. 32-5/1]
MSHIVPGRSCAACSLCCILPDIDALAKPANTVCRHCAPGVGCLVYADRPQLCADFHCRWITDVSMAPAWEPTLAHMMVYAQGPQITVLVDPAQPDAYMQAPYWEDLQQWAADIDASGGFVIVFVGDTAIKVEPELRKR